MSRAWVEKVRETGKFRVEVTSEARDGWWLHRDFEKKDEAISARNQLLSAPGWETTVQVIGPDGDIVIKGSTIPTPIAPPKLSWWHELLVWLRIR